MSDDEYEAMRLAVQLAGQLPEDIAKARRVVACMTKVIDRCFAPAKSSPNVSGSNVTAFSGKRGVPDRVEAERCEGD